MSIGRYKLLLLGDASVGKSAYMHKLVFGIVGERRFDTQVLLIRTNYGDVAFCAHNQPRRTEDYRYSDCAIIMFDLLRPSTLDSVPKYIEVVRRECGDIPMVIVGNKSDLCESPSAYLTMSAHTGTNVDKPFLQLSRTLTGHSDLHFT